MHCEGTSGLLHLMTIRCYHLLGWWPSSVGLITSLVLAQCNVFSDNIQFDGYCRFRARFKLGGCSKLLFEYADHSLEWSNETSGDNLLGIAAKHFSGSYPSSWEHTNRKSVFSLPLKANPSAIFWEWNLCYFASRINRPLFSSNHFQIPTMTDDITTSIQIFEGNWDRKLNQADIIIAKAPLISQTAALLEIQPVVKKPERWIHQC